MVKHHVAPVVALALAIGAFSAGAPSALAATFYDPAARWRTIITPHFRVNYPDGLESQARRAAGFAEEAHEKLVPWMKTTPQQPTELTLLDHLDDANGFAFPYPNNAIFIYLTSPTQDSHEYGRNESWFKTLIMHEYLHVLHEESVGGLVKGLNTVLGRAFFPHIAPGEPLFLLEGLAVTAESRYTNGGRGYSSHFDMDLRSAALAGKLPAVDQINGFQSFGGPGSYGAYSYGAWFYKYVMTRYGADVPPKIAEIYGSEPWFGIDGAFQKAVGRDVFQVWDEFLVWLKARYALQEAQIRETPLTRFDRVTTSGKYHRHPHFLADGTLLYGEYTGRSWSRVKSVAPSAASGSATPRYDEAAAKEYFAKSPLGGMSRTADGRWIFYSRTHAPDDFHGFDEIFRFDTRDKSLVRLTERKRASEPAVSPDGTQIMAVLGGGGRNDLALFDAGGTLLRKVTKNSDGTEYSGLTWSPDGRRVALSSWKDQWRDLYLVDPATGRQTPLWRDAAADRNPAWTPDGKWLLFDSDRTGVPNLYAVRLADRQVFRVTNVLGGAFEPAVSPDMRTLAFASYGADGYDIATMSFRPETWQIASSEIREARDEDGRFVPVRIAEAKEAEPAIPVRLAAAGSATVPVSASVS
ncbi:MAG: PD40 domain-containing protein, partial [Candidatus Sericytochromatia bacterium]|nr:PD40 domain-containing protein [Candidatus Tanganyikabacteria bacterium]